MEPRPEYPRPHRVRPRWLNLNGEWEFAFDDADRGRRGGWHSGHEFSDRIIVPFSFESRLSGIDQQAAHPIVWYRRSIDIPADLMTQKLLLHIGACDFATTVWVNGAMATMHRGGYAPIVCEIDALVFPGRNELVLRAEDRPSWAQPRGKQIIGDAPVLIDYDRVTGIWQSVWLEPVPQVYIDDCWSVFSLAESQLTVWAAASQETSAQLEVVVSLAGEPLVSARAWMQDRREGQVTLQLPSPQLWSPRQPTLYDLCVRLRDGEAVIDEVQSYAGLREWTTSGGRVLLNGEPFFFGGVLDQGYFPDGWYTAPSDEALKRDVALILELGFNGVRKHQKAEDPRWLYWADRLGLVVWSEMPSGRDFCPALVDDLTREWLEIVRRDRMHPSIMAWVPFNESWGIDGVGGDARQQAWVRALYQATKSLDPSRLVIGNDGWQHCAGDIWGLHLYLSSPDDLQAALRRLLAQPTTEVIPLRPGALSGVDVAGLPIMLTEFGGLACRTEPMTSAAWGYDTMADAAEFERRVRALVLAVRSVPELSGFVWTQFTDVQQEVNGLLRFDRTSKLPLSVLRTIFADRPQC